MATFHEQAAKGDASALTTLLAADPDALNSVDADGRTPLHWAAANGHAGAMELLLAASPDSAGNACDVDHQDEGGWTALMSAVSAGHEGAVALLLAAGASPRIANKLAQAPLHFHRGRADMVAALLGSAAASASAASAASAARSCAGTRARLPTVTCDSDGGSQRTAPVGVKMIMEGINEREGATFPLNLECFGAKIGRVRAPRHT